MENKKTVSSKGLALLVCTGGSMGALVGLYVGMSTSPIVSTIVGTLTSLLTTLVGLKLVLDKSESSEAEAGEAFDSFKIKMVLLSSFAAGCILFTLSGLYLRTHNTFSPSLAEKFSDWEKAGFSKEETKKIVLFQELGIQTGAGGISDGISATSDVKESTKAGTSVLFSAEVNVGACELLNVSEEQSLNMILDNFTTNGGIWEKWANDINQKIPQEYKKQSLLALKESVCAGSSFKVEKEDCLALTPLRNASSIKELNKAVKQNPVFWQTLNQKAENYFNGNDSVRLLFVQTIASTVCN